VGCLGGMCGGALPKKRSEEDLARRVRAWKVRVHARMCTLACLRAHFARVEGRSWTGAQSGKDGLGSYLRSKHCIPDGATYGVKSWIVDLCPIPTTLFILPMMLPLAAFGLKFFGPTHFCFASCSAITRASCADTHRPCAFTG